MTNNRCELIAQAPHISAPQGPGRGRPKITSAMEEPRPFPPKLLKTHFDFVGAVVWPIWFLINSGCPALPERARLVDSAQSCMHGACLHAVPTRLNQQTQN
ncbi:cysteine protease atg4 [Pyricularia oryzae]|nr:cysteine protease atg4 [Pyricularia oryzae]KAI7923430.1 cysteine protease atg4 [Pyricularia oryzae]